MITTMNTSVPNTSSTEPECRYYGRDFSTTEMTVLRELLASDKNYSRWKLSKVFCERIGWYKTDGGLKDMTARCTMLAMHRDGIITLPPPRQKLIPRKPIVFGIETDEPAIAIPTSLQQLQPLQFQIVHSAMDESKLWNQFIERYHYLGYKTLVGAQMRYLVTDREDHPIALFGFSTAAWRLAPRDRWIGWTDQQREQNLPRVIDNPRFLILPWVCVPNLGSHLLAIMKRRVPFDWYQRYHVTPVLIETFVQIPTYTGSVYRASNWIHLGVTQGRGRNDCYRRADKPKKDIWVKPLQRNWKKILNSG